MRNASRRQFLKQVGVSTVLLSGGGSIAAWAVEAMGTTGPAVQRGGNQTRAFDLLIKGGRVVDPAQKIAAPMDVGVRDGKIALVAADIPASDAGGILNATGKIVTPGFIDAHGHVFDGGIPLSIDPDVVGVPKGVSTIVDGGSAGAAGFAAFRKDIIERARTRVYALLNIGTGGCCSNEIYGDLALVDPGAALATIEQNRSIILGIKVRIHGRHDELPHDLEVLKRARQVADASNLPIMMHWSNEPDLISLLKRGDILTHPFNPPSTNSSNLLGGASGKVLPIVNTLKDRGIWTDFSHGSHFDWAVAEAAAKEGWFPDTISTDIHRRNVPPNGPVNDLPTTLSKFLYLGLSVEQAIEAVTAAPAKMYKFPEKLGSLEPGSVADVTISEIRSGQFEFVDSRRVKRVATKRFVPTGTVKAGTIMYWGD